jgi:hypothetical protein
MVALNIKRITQILFWPLIYIEYIYEIKQYWSGEVFFEANSHMPFPR